MVALFYSINSDFVADNNEPIQFIGSLSKIQKKALAQDIFKEKDGVLIQIFDKANFKKFEFINIFSDNHIQKYTMPYTYKFKKINKGGKST